jgi:hypothetical protein
LSRNCSSIFNSTFGGDRTLAPGEGGVQGVPGERRAFHPRGKFPNARERLELAELRAARRLAVGHQVVELLEERLHLLDLAALERLGHEGRGGRGDGAAPAFERHVADHAILDLEVHLHVVAAERVVALRLVARAVHRMAVPRRLVVVEDQLLVEVAQFAAHAKSLRASSMPAASASTSPRVL